MVTRERSGSLKEGFPLHLSYEINVRIAYFFVAVAHNLINVLLRQANASRSSHWCTASRTRSVQGNNVDATIVASMQIFGPTDWTRKKNTDNQKSEAKTYPSANMPYSPKHDPFIILCIPAC